MRRRVLLATLWALTLAAAGCGVGAGTTELTVFAAGSLTDAFTDIKDLYEEQHPGVDVTLNFLASSDLATQIEQGAPADVFASADESNMQRVVDAGLTARGPKVFAHNKLEIIVPIGNPGNVGSLRDLEDEYLMLAICAEECPAGRYAREIIERAGLEVEPDSLEAEVKAVVTRVELGEADAGIVYVTDVLTAGDDVAGVEIPDEDNVIATYLLATLSDAPRAADEFVDLALSGEGQRILLEYGFLGR